MYKLQYILTWGEKNASSWLAENNTIIRNITWQNQEDGSVINSTFCFFVVISMQYWKVKTMKSWNGCNMLPEQREKEKCVIIDISLQFAVYKYIDIY
jgi:hypothetical protein